MPVQCHHIISEVDGHNAKEDEDHQLAHAVVRERVGTGTVGKGTQGDQDANRQQPPAAVGDETATHDAGKRQQAEGHVAQRVGADVSFGNTAAGTHAARFVSALQVVKVLVGHV